VSIVTPAFNAGRFIDHTIDSVVAQTLPSWEMLIIDDHSRDDTYERAQRRARGDRRITAVRNPTNRGPGPTRNEALRRARGKYLAFLDADDLWDPEKLQRQLAFMQRGRYVFTYTSYRVVSQDGELLSHIGRVPEFQDYADMLKDTIVGCLTVMLDREALGEMWFPILPLSQDLAMWLSILRRGHRAYGLQDELASYRVVSTSITRNKLKSARAVWAVMRKAEKLPLIDTLRSFSSYALHATMRQLATHARW
jgi:teichuronic acid biosynthesis glycosyltransferase TuaG